MNKLFYIILGLIGIVIIVGVVLFLRSRNTPGAEYVGQTGVKTEQTNQVTTGKIAPKLMPFTPTDKTKVAPPYKPGDPGPPSEEDVEMP